MVDSIAYTSDGKSYPVSSSVMDQKARGILISNFKREGLTDVQIQKRLSLIEKLVMDSSVAENHPDSHIKNVAGRLDLSPEDKEIIYRMTQGISDSFGDVNLLHRGVSFGVVGLADYGMHVITSEELRNLVQGNSHYHAPIKRASA